MFTADQLVLHLIGDYILQSDYMANQKTKSKVAALTHVLTYSVVFLFLTRSVPALLFIGATHFAIDHWRLARYVCWAKNFLAPRSSPLTGKTVCLEEGIAIVDARGPVHINRVEVTSDEDGNLWREGVIVGRCEQLWWHPWAECSATGYHKNKPLWLNFGLLILADNTLHIICNGLALKYL